MTTLLHVSSSPRGAASESLTIASAFLDGYRADWLRWTGITDVRSVRFRPDLATADAEAGRRTARDEARELGWRF